MIKYVAIVTPCHSVKNDFVAIVYNHDLALHAKEPFYPGINIFCISTAYYQNIYLTV